MLLNVFRQMAIPSIGEKTLLFFRILTKQTFPPLLGYFFKYKINQKSRNKPIWPTSRCILNHFFEASSENTKKPSRREM